MGKQKLIGVSNNIVTVKNEIQTDIFNGGSSEFFINMNPKDIPPKEHEDRGDFVRREKKKCREGITIGGIWIPGRLYYFLNYHKMTIDILEKGTGEILRKVANPLLRDNDWEIFENYEQAQKDKEVFLIGSGRQVGKSQILSALTTYEINLKPNAEALLLFTNSADKETVVKIIQTAMKDGEKFMYLPNIDNDWKKTQIRFGTTNKDNTTDVRARLFMYNTAGDNKGEIAAGKTLTFFAMDEIAKESILEAYTALKPALVSIYGKRCAGYMSFTGGNVEKSKDAETIFFEPGAYTVKKFVNEGKETGFFLPGTYRQDFKHEIPFSDYLSNRGHVVEKGTELDKMKIFVTDYERANAVLDQEQVDAAKTRDPTALLKHKMYFPRSIKEMFTKGNTLGFKPEYIRQQREYIKSGAVDITPVELFRNSQTGEVKHKISEKSHPFVFDWKNPGFTTDAAIAIYDFPKYTSHGVHVIGVDPIREDEVGSSNSLGYITVLRRMHSDLTDPFRGKQVASYLGRCKTVKEFHQMLLNLAEWYNAQILYEHSDRDLLSFFENKHKGYLLMDTVKFQQEINVKTKTKNPKGLRPTPTNKKFLINSTLGWVNDEMEDDTLGYSGIFDDILLQQLEAYDPDENLDAYIGFSHAVAAYNYFEKFGTPVVTLDNKIEEKKKTSPIIKNAFGMSFKHKPKNAFGI